MFYSIENVTNPNATSFTFNLIGWATLRFRLRAVNRFGPSRPSVATSKFCRTDVGREYTFGFSTITCVSEMWRSVIFPPPPGKRKLNAAVADPDLPIRGGGGGGGLGGHPHPEIRGGWSQKKCFRPFGPQFGLKISGELGPPGPSPESATVSHWFWSSAVKKMLTFESLGEITCCVSHSKSLQNLLGCFLILSSMLKHSWKRGDLKSLYF